MRPTTKKVVLFAVLALPLLLVFADEFPEVKKTQTKKREFGDLKSPVSHCQPSLLLS
jgi:hypothetical protein